MNGKDDQILSSWKEIAAYFGKGVRTVQRWERQLGLPIRRPQGLDAQIVFARKSELAQWMGKRAGTQDDLVPVSGGQRSETDGAANSPEPQSSSSGVHTKHSERMQRLVNNTQPPTERLRANTARFLQSWEPTSKQGDNQ